MSLVTVQGYVCCGRLLHVAAEAVTYFLDPTRRLGR